MTNVEFSRAAGHLLNAPYWNDYAGSDANECVRHYQQRDKEKALLTAACIKVERVGGNLDDLPADALRIWKAAAETLGTNNN